MKMFNEKTAVIFNPPYEINLNKLDEKIDFTSNKVCLKPSHRSNLQEKLPLKRKSMSNAGKYYKYAELSPEFPGVKIISGDLTIYHNNDNKVGIQLTSPGEYDVSIYNKTIKKMYDGIYPSMKDIQEKQLLKKGNTYFVAHYFQSNGGGGFCFRKTSKKVPIVYSPEKDEMVGINFKTYLKCEDAAHGEKIRRMTTSKLYNFLTYFLIHIKCNTIQYLPLPELSTYNLDDSIDEWLYKEFQLAEEEIQHLEKALKESRT